MATAWYTTGTGGTGSENVWSYWVDATTSTSTATTDTVWASWTNTATTTSTTCDNDTWYVWVTHDSSGAPVQRVVRSSGYREYEFHGGPKPLPLHDAHVHAHANEQWRIAAEERKRKREEAEARAEELLHTSLNQAQREQLERDGFFFVGSKKPGRRYRIRKGRMGNVDVVEKNRVIHRLCAHPNVDCPDDDTRLAQKLMLEHMEDRFIGLANVHRARSSEYIQ